MGTSETSVRSGRAQPTLRRGTTFHFRVFRSVAKCRMMARLSDGSEALLFLAHTRREAIDRVFRRLAHSLPEGTQVIYLERLVGPIYAGQWESELPGQGGFVLHVKRRRPRLRRRCWQPGSIPKAPALQSFRSRCDQRLAGLIVRGRRGSITRCSTSRNRLELPSVETGAEPTRTITQCLCGNRE